jgi:hypothetical protein
MRGRSVGFFFSDVSKSDLLAWRSWSGVDLIRENHDYNFCLVVAWAFFPKFLFLLECSSALLKQSLWFLVYALWSWCGWVVLLKQVLCRFCHVSYDNSL